MQALDITKKIDRLHLPIHATIKLTYKCNFRCLHCYQTPEKNNHTDCELNTDDWVKIIDLLKEKHVLTIQFTGGEVFARSDFIDIYMYAYNRNFKIVVLTNLSMLSTKILNLFKKYPPMCISTTLYGFSEETYFKFTKRKNTFISIMNGIKQLLHYKIPLKIKVIANICNRHELDDMYIFFHQHQISYFFTITS